MICPRCQQECPTIFTPPDLGMSVCWDCQRDKKTTWYEDSIKEGSPYFGCCSWCKKWIEPEVIAVVFNRPGKYARFHPDCFKRSGFQIVTGQLL
jgi:hypothetical protein